MQRGNVHRPRRREIDFLAATEVEDRLRRATGLFIKQQSISEVSKKIATAVDESLSRQQKEYFLRQQLAAIQRELHSLHSTTPGPISSPGATGFGMGNSGGELDEDEQADADDLADLRKKIEALGTGSEERKIGVREWRRLKRIPQGSVENGVIRTYVRCYSMQGLQMLTRRLAGMVDKYPVAVCAGFPDNHAGCNHGSRVPGQGSVSRRPVQHQSCLSRLLFC